MKWTMLFKQEGIMTKLENELIQSSKIRKARTTNRRLPQWQVKWLIEHYTSHHLLCCIDSLVLRIENQRS
jgi:hypothetical protein